MLDEKITSLVKKVFQQKLKNKYEDPIKGDENIFTDLGVDSLLLMEIIIELEDIFDITFDDENLTMENLSTINRISSLIHNSFETN